MSDLRQRIANLSPEKRALLELRLMERGTPVAKQQEIARRGTSDPCPLSFAQERLWFLDQLEPGSPVYNIPAAFRLNGPLDVRALEQSLNEIVRRHEALRTTFSVVEGQPVQVIAPTLTLVLPVVDLRDLPETPREAKARRVATEEAQRPFDLARGPLLRATLLRRQEEEHILLLTMHHIVSDGWSMGVLFRELAALYEAFSTRRPSPLPELPIQYADFAIWQRQWLQGEVLEAQLSYWKEKLAGSPPSLDLPTDHLRPAMQTYRGARQSLVLPKSLSESLKALSREEGATLFMTLLAAFKTLLYRYTGQEDIVVSSPIANRTRVEIEGLIGFFVNTLVLRTDLSGDPTFGELLRRVREVALGAYAHQDLPFEKLVEELQPERDLSRTPLFQAMFQLRNVPKVALELSGLTLCPLEVDSETAKFDLTLSMVEGAEGLRGTLEYNTDLYEAATMTRMLGHFQVLLEGIVVDAEKRLSELPLLREAERHEMLVEWNDTKTAYPREQCIHEVFEAQVERTPEAVAVVFEGEELSYRELNRRANQLAHHLQKLGVGPEVLVGIYLERSLDMVVGLLGILKAGGAYVPLDPAYPKERLAFMLEDTQVSVLLTQERVLPNLPQFEARVVCLDGDWEVMAQESEEDVVSGATAENLAYVMYTSGSTGKPKGVSVVHRGVVRLVKETSYADLTGREVFLQLAPISFDASTFEIWGSLLNGARLVVFPSQIPSLQELGEVLERYQVTTLWLTAGLFHQMVEDHVEGLRPVRQLLAGGDVLSAAHVKEALHHLGGCRLVNGYGPTEGTTFTCCYRLTDGSQVGTSVSIGRPIANTQVYILDRHLQPVPIGVAGEVYIGGDGLARGYLNRPELTAEQFIPHPFTDEPGARLYKSGDLARYRPDGNIEFLGRIDDQVKIRGFRVELGEIEAVLGQHPAVREAVVLAREDEPGDPSSPLRTGKRLVAYFVPAKEHVPAINELRSFLKQKLPDYMVPFAFVMLDALPLTPSGKVDRRALPVPDTARPELEEAFVAPHTPLESLIAEVWQEALSVDRVGVYDNFFDLGGHSLLAMQVVARLETKLGLRINPRELIFQTLGQLASSCEERMHLRQQSDPMSFTQKLWGAIKSAVFRRTDDRK